MKPYADDWQQLNQDTQYSKSKDLYYHKGRVYDRLSASHNGIIGAGAQLRSIIAEANKK